MSIYRIDLKRDDARATVLYFGGNGFRTGLHARRVFDAYAGQPVDLVLVDHRGYGASTGTPTPSIKVTTTAPARLPML